MSGRVIGLTLSERQQEYAVDKLAKVSTGRDVEVRLKGWEEFDGTVDRIVSIGAFEHFGHAQFAKFIMTEIFPGGRLPSVSMI